MKKKTAAIVLAVLLVLGGGAYGISRMSGGEGTSEGTVPVISVASLGDTAAAVSNRFSGVVETQKKNEIKLDGEKTVKEVLVAEGDHVNENDALFVYDTQKTELEIAQKELEKEKLNSSITGYKEQIDQLNSELNKGNLSSADRMTMNAQILENQTSIAQAEYDLKAADAEIAGMKASIKNATVRAPMAGTLEKVEDPNLMMDSSAAFITIVAEGDFRVKGTLSEQSIGTVYEDMEMLVRSRVDSDQVWTGKVVSIESKQEEDENPMMDFGGGDMASKYAFYVVLDSMDGLLLGQHVTLEPSYGEMEGLVLPFGYLACDEDGSVFVYAVAKPGDQLEKRKVETGEEYMEQGMVQILSGLEESEYVAWPENEDCREGAETSANAFAEGADGREG
ncbi:MAG: efflux RND transporter periplasmic adaptor subunit [Lachnospiraceae bacterium]|nr:efflux RND transporter periplasmic adaptor subunit [Lachnospiraceae bacterium]